MENSIIMDAIRIKKQLKFNYNGQNLSFEPYFYGYDKFNDDLLFGILKDGSTSSNWQTIQVSEIKSLTLSNSYFILVDIIEIPKCQAMVFKYSEWTDFYSNKK